MTTIVVSDTDGIIKDDEYLTMSKYPITVVSEKNHVAQDDRDTIFITVESGGLLKNTRY